MTIYLDEFFLLNFCVDFFVLWLAGKLTGEKSKIKRLLVAAGVGGIYAVLVLLPEFFWLGTWWGKLVCSCLMLGVAYSPKNIYIFGKFLAYLYAISFLIAGTTTALMYSFGQQAIQTWNGIALLSVDYRLLWLFLAVLVVGILAHFLYLNLRKDLPEGEWLVELTIGLEEKERTLTALIDTGNNLTEPLSANPVILVEDWCLWQLLPEELVKALRDNVAVDELFLTGAATNIGGKMRLIPYQTIGQQGILWGFKPDWLRIEDKNRQVIHHEVIVALTKQKFSLQNHYQGLAQAKLL